MLLGNRRCRTFEFVNRGGDGCFLLLTTEQWAATLQQHRHSQDSSRAPADHAAPTPAAALAVAAATEGDWDGQGAAEPLVPSGPFHVGPACLDLPAGAAGVLTVEFSPEEQGPQAADYVLLCDNCTAHPLRVEGYGEQVQVEVVGVDGRPWLPQDAQAPLWFGQVSRLGPHPLCFADLCSHDVSVPYRQVLRQAFCNCACVLNGSNFEVSWGWRRTPCPVLPLAGCDSLRTKLHMIDILAWGLSMCAQVFPGAHSTRRLRVSNPTELPFPFRWSVDSAQAGAFSVSPSSGVLQVSRTVCRS